VVAGLAADNLIVALYFGFLFYMAKGDAGTSADGSVPPPNSATQQLNGGWDSGGGGAAAAAEPAGPLVGRDGLAAALAAGCALTLGGCVIAERVLGGAISAIPITSLLTVAAASLFPKVRDACCADTKFRKPAAKTLCPAHSMS
jgi:hypothetical protein